jgi:hypothetical protein
VAKIGYQSGERQVIRVANVGYQSGERQERKFDLVFPRMSQALEKKKVIEMAKCMQYKLWLEKWRIKNGGNIK